MDKAAETSDVAAPPFQVIDLPQPSQADRIELPQSLPFLRALIGELFDLQSGPSERYGRWYQKSLVQRGFFEITSPRTGQRIRSSDSLMAHAAVFYRFASEPNLLLAAPSDQLGYGYPMAGIVCLDQRVMFRMGEVTWGVKLASVESVEAMLCDPQWRTVRAAQEVRILTGDVNFAHHAWNQLGALEHLAPIIDPRLAVTIETTAQPLGPLAELLPELKNVPILPRSMEAWNGNKPGRVDVLPGSTIMTRTVRERILKVATARAPPPWRQTAERLVALRRPVIWISIRTLNRTALNQHAAVSLLCTRLFGLYPNCAIILDGYSLSDDWQTNASFGDGESQRRFVAQDMKAASAIVDELRTAGHPSPTQELILAVGLNLLESVLLAHAAHFYVCHHGTVQHKIGWLAAKPGVVHTNLRALRQNVASWISDQVEEPPAVFYIPAEMVRDAGEKALDTLQNQSRFFDNYEFVDIGRFTDYVIAKLQAFYPQP